MDLVEETSPGVVALLLDDLAPVRLGTLLRGARKRRALTRRDVAAQVGTTPSELRRYERGDAPVPPAMVAALAECYGEDLTAQFVMRMPIQVDRRHLVVGTEDVSLESGADDDALGTYVGLVARLRHAKPGEPIALRTNDLVALSTALGQDPEHVESRIVELLGCTPHEARSLHTELLRRKLVLPVAGLVTGLAVVTGVGVAAASPDASAGHVSGNRPAAHASPAPTHQTTAPPTTAVANPGPAPTVAPTTLAPASVDPATAPAVAAAPVTEAPVTQPAPETTVAPAPVAAEAAAAPKAPVITTDTTPVGIPANETVTIIQP